MGLPGRQRDRRVRVERGKKADNGKKEEGRKGVIFRLPLGGEDRGSMYECRIFTNWWGNKRGKVLCFVWVTGKIVRYDSEETFQKSCEGTIQYHGAITLKKQNPEILKWRPNHAIGFFLISFPPCSSCSRNGCGWASGRRKKTISLAFGKGTYEKNGATFPFLSFFSDLSGDFQKGYDGSSR